MPKSKISDLKSEVLQSVATNVKDEMVRYLGFTGSNTDSNLEQVENILVSVLKDVDGNAFDDLSAISALQTHRVDFENISKYLMRNFTTDGKKFSKEAKLSYTQKAAIQNSFYYAFNYTMLSCGKDRLLSSPVSQVMEGVGVSAKDASEDYQHFLQELKEKANVDRVQDINPGKFLHVRTVVNSAYAQGTKPETALFMKPGGGCVIL